MCCTLHSDIRGKAALWTWRSEVDDLMTGGHRWDTQLNDVVGLRSLHTRSERTGSRNDSVYEAVHTNASDRQSANQNDAKRLANRF